MEEGKDGGTPAGQLFIVADRRATDPEAKISVRGIFTDPDELERAREQYENTLNAGRYAGWYSIETYALVKVGVCDRCGATAPLPHKNDHNREEPPEYFCDECERAAAARRLAPVADGSPVVFSLSRMPDAEQKAGHPNRFRITTEAGVIECFGTGEFISAILSDLLADGGFCGKRIADGLRQMPAAEILRMIDEAGMSSYMPEGVISALRAEAAEAADRIRRRAVRLEQLRAGFGTGVLQHIAADHNLNGVPVGLVEPGAITHCVELLADVPASGGFRAAYEGDRLDVPVTVFVADTFPRRIMRVGCRGDIWDGRLVEVVGDEDEGRGLVARLLDAPDATPTRAFPFTALDETAFVERATVSGDDELIGVSVAPSEATRRLLEREREGEPFERGPPSEMLRRELLELHTFDPDAGKVVGNVPSLIIAEEDDGGEGVSRALRLSVEDEEAAQTLRFAGARGDDTTEIFSRGAIGEGGESEGDETEGGE